MQPYSPSTKSSQSMINNFKTISTRKYLSSGKSIILLPSSDTFECDEIIDLYLYNSSPLIYELGTPIPSQTFSPSNKHQQYMKEKIVEEFISSEQDFIACLRLLSIFYLEPLLEDLNCFSAMSIAYGLIETLRNLHNKFLLELNTSIVHGVDTFVDVVIRFFSQLYSVRNIYIDYIYYFEEINNLKPYLLSLQKDKIIGAQRILESTQPFPFKIDLSFHSLLSKPISRLTKYRILMETLMKYSDQNKDEEQLAYKYVLNTLKTINNECQETSLMKVDKDNKYFLVNELMQDKSILGKPQLVGSLFCIWLESSGLKHEWCGIYNYKSHIVISVVPFTRSKDLIFIIPYTSSSISYHNTLVSGLTTNYYNTIKILFENSYQIFELLLIPVSDKEFSVWEESFSTFTNLNGANQLNFQYSAIFQNYPTLIKFPKLHCPFDVEVSKVSLNILTRCYFAKLYPIDINLFIKPFKLKQYSIVIKSDTRLLIEKLLEKHWSVEIPLLKVKLAEKHRTTFWFKR